MIKKDFFKDDAHLIAPKLLGYKLCTSECEAIITEIEAYEGENDEASHAFKLTPKSKIMFETKGHCYVYFVYGNHYCLNFTCGQGAGAVLIREAIPIKGIELMKKRRGKEKVEDLCSGPGKLCQAFGIDKKYNGIELGKEIWLDKASEKEKKQANLIHNKIVAFSRVGISKEKKKEWRFKLV